MLRLPADRARDLCLEALGLLGLPPDQATTCADAIMFATLRGLVPPDLTGVTLAPP